MKITILLALIVVLTPVILGSSRSEQELRSHLNANPFDLNSRLDLSLLLAKQGNIYDAAEQFHFAREVSPKSEWVSAAHSLLGEIGVDASLLSAQPTSTRVYLLPDPKNETSKPVKGSANYVPGETIRMPLSAFSNMKELEFEISEQSQDIYGIKELNLQPDDIVIDIGANMGVFSTYIAMAYPGVRVIAVEPIPVAFRTLQHNIKQNGLENQVTAILGAIVSNPDTTNVSLMYDPQYTVFSAVSDVLEKHPEFWKKRGPKLQPREVRVPAFTLQAIMDRFNISHVTMLKIDCEGCEFGVLPALDPWQFDVIRGELHADYAPNQHVLDQVTAIFKWASKSRRRPVSHYRPFAVTLNGTVPL